MNGVWAKVRGAISKVWTAVKKLFQKIGAGLKRLWQNFLRSFARWVDPKLEAYREPVNKKHPVDDEPSYRHEVVVEEVVCPVTQTAPETREDLFALLREAPMTVLTSSERKAMAAILELPNTHVSELMTPAVKIVFVNQDEKMGPLVLDKLYKSGFTYFPVVDGRQHIIGTLHTALLNSLDIKDTKPAHEVMEPRVYYIRGDYTLEQALKAFLRTNSQLMLVVDHYEKLLGMLTFEQIMSFLFSEKYQDDFARDNDRAAVAKRR